jgi:hypothetical protein
MFAAHGPKEREIIDHFNETAIIKKNQNSQICHMVPVMDLELTSSLTGQEHAGQNCKYMKV